MLGADKGVITTMAELFEKMANGGWGSRKTGATLCRMSSTPPGIYVEERFDDGKGHSGAFTSKRKAVAPELFKEALAKRYISGSLKPGYVSDWEFHLSDSGKWEHAEMMRIAEIARGNLYPGKGMRICDMQAYLPEVPEEKIGEVLEDLVRRRYAESGEHHGQRFYFLHKQGAAV